MSLASDSLVTIELAIVFLASLFFSVLYENRRDEIGFLAGVGWIVLGVYYFVVFAETTSYVISFFFVIIGILYLARSFFDVLKMEDAVQSLKDAEVDF